jgi:hypothetical protein
VNPKHPAGPPMTLGNMRELGVQRPIASCLNEACRHTALIDVSSYSAETEVPYFRSKVVCAKCGSKGNKIDVRPNRKEQPTQPSPNRQGVALASAPPERPTFRNPSLPEALMKTAGMARLTRAS